MLLKLLTFDTEKVQLSIDIVYYKQKLFRYLRFYPDFMFVYLITYTKIQISLISTCRISTIRNKCNKDPQHFTNFAKFLEGGMKK